MSTTFNDDVLVNATVGIGTTPATALDVKGTLRLRGATSGWVGLAPASSGSEITYNLPSADGSSGQALTTDGSHNLSWSTITTGQTIQTITATGTQNDFSITAARRLVLRCNNSSDVTFSGFSAGGAAPSDGDLLYVASVGAGAVFFKHQNTGSSAAYRLINFATSGDTPLAAGVGWAEFVYDGTTQRWRLVAHEQGAVIARAYSSGDYTGSGSLTWTVDSGDVDVNAYYLRGRCLTMTLSVVNTSTGGSASDRLQVSIPNGYTAMATQGSVGFYNDAGGGNGYGVVVVVSGGTTVQQQKSDSGNFSPSASNNTHVRWTLTFGIN